MKKVILCFLLFYVYSNTYSQSIGLTLGSTDYNITSQNEYYPNQYGSIKDISLNYKIPLGKSLFLSLKGGYGWGSYTTLSESRELLKMNTSTHKSEISTSGFPCEFEIAYQHFISQDSIFAPSVGFGINYCTYKTTSDNASYSNNYEYKTNGFSQFISFGMNFYFSRKFSCYVGAKKTLLSSITTSNETYSSGYYSFYERDYDYQPGLSGLDFSFGIYYKI